MRRGTLVGVVMALAAAFALPSAASAGDAPSRYDFAGGCWTISSGGVVGTDASQLRFQATDLGSYLLYRTDHTVLSANPDGTVSPTAAASPSADWVLDGAGGVYNLAPKSDPGMRLAVGTDGSLSVEPYGVSNRTQVGIVPAEGCAVYPEAELGATGKPFKGRYPYGRVRGLLEGHMHWMTFEFLGGQFHCGRPWHPYGIPYALPDCSGIEGPQGSTAIIQNFLNYGQPVSPHDTTGWPKLTSWSHHNLTYEGTYWKWIQRAWMGGLRLMVMSVNENRILCELQSNRTTNCDEMDTVRRGFDDIRQLQRYVDAQAGGPGKGFFQIVTSPNQARKVINEGKMAVVLEIEVSELFGCKGTDGQSSCDRAQIDRELNEMYDDGVRSSLLLNKFDNPLVGVRFDGGTIGVLINAANKLSSGSFWSAKTCTSKFHDNTIEQATSDNSGLFNAILGLLGIPAGSVPAYPPAPHCNTRGLTDLGKYVEERMIDKHMIINPDHMSQRGVDATLDVAEAHDYSGVISPHGWMDPGNWPRIWKLGGLAFPDSNTSTTYIDDYDKYRPKRTPYLLGWGYGADLGGLADQPSVPEGTKPVSYPFKSGDGAVTFERQRTGERTFDYNTDAIAHYGLYADWYRDLQLNGPKQMTTDMDNAAEAYLEMWERADGIPAPACSTAGARVSPKGLRKMRLRDGWQKLLRRAGQPQSRNRAWVWCVKGKRNRRAADVAELSAKGSVELIGSTARGRRAAGLGIGTKGSRLVARGARPAGRNLLTLRASRKSRYVFAVHGGRVRAVGVATAGLASRKGALRKAMARVIAARGSQAKRTFVPNPKAGRLTGRSLAGSVNPRLNRQLQMLCHLNRTAFLAK